MRIAIDLRSLSSGSISGVENYTLNLLESLLTLDKQNKYVLFYNSFRSPFHNPSLTLSRLDSESNRASKGEGNKIEDFHFINSQIKRTRIPSKLLNLLLKTGVLKLESLTGPIDCFFMPNLNQFCLNPNTKLALTVHDLSPIVTPQHYDLKRKLWHRFINYKYALQRANLIFAVSDYTKRDLVRLFDISADKIKVVYPGVDLNVFKPNLDAKKLREIRNLYGLPGNYLLFLNTIEPRKNLTNLIKAFDLLPIQTNLVIAGKKGWKYKKIFSGITKSKKSAQIKYLGYIPEQDKPAIIAMARALVYPSFYEGFGFQSLEAAACGVPIVASNVTAIPEILEGSCLLVNPYDIKQIAKGIEEVLSNEQLRQQLIEKGKLKARKFSWENTAKEILMGLERLENEDRN